MRHFRHGAATDPGRVPLDQTEDEEFADIEAAREDEDITLMAIPTELVPEVWARLARKQGD